MQTGGNFAAMRMFRNFDNRFTANGPHRQLLYKEPDCRQLVDGRLIYLGYHGLQPNEVYIFSRNRKSDY